MTELNIFRTARARCQNPKHISYAYYGGRGITFEIATFEENPDKTNSLPFSELTSKERVKSETLKGVELILVRFCKNTASRN